MITGKTKSGFKYEIESREVFDSMEFIEMLGALEDEEFGRFPKLVELVLGKEQKQAFYDHVRGDKKFTPALKLQEEFFDLLSDAGKKEKN